MTKAKRNKAKFWCHKCERIGWRNPADAEAYARTLRRTAVQCPEGWGWHIK